MTKSASVSAPILSRVKSWQLVGLGLSGWCTLYSIALITWGASSAMVGNTQGGCFAATMTLASFEARRYRKSCSPPVDPLAWTQGVTTERINQTIAKEMEKREFRVEPCRPTDTEMGFGVRAVNSGRTMVFETGRWQEPVIDLNHAQSTEENRKKASADLASIVGAGKPDENAVLYVQTRPVQFLVDKELQQLLGGDKPGQKTA
jgi:hypothetical protein